MTRFYGGTGDDGYTGLLGGGRVPKYDPRPEAYGAVDEASAALGLARALARSPEARRVTEQVQRHLYGLMAELAALPEHAARFRAVGADEVAWLEGQIDALAEKVTLPKEFILGGDSLAGGAYDLARTVVRRAERHVARLLHEGQLENPHLLAYLNRLSSLCYVLVLWENAQAGVDRPTTAKQDGT